MTHHHAARPAAPSVPRRGALAALAAGSAALALPVGSAFAAPTRFRDVQTTTKFAREILWLADSRITMGYPDSTFRPLGTVNRDAMAAFLFRAAGEPFYTPPSRSRFRDIEPGAQFFTETAWLAATGISTGWPDRTFRPLEPVRRDAMAAFLYRAAGSPRFAAPSRSPFRDVTPTTLFYKEICWLASTGISTGWPDRTFRPGLPVARDAMAAFLHRAIATTRVITPATFPKAAPEPGRTFEEQVADLLFVKTNEERRNAGRTRVRRDPRIDAVALPWSTTMGATGTFEHNPNYAAQMPPISDPAFRDCKSENIAWASRGSKSVEAVADQIMESWMDSDGHRDNIYDPRFTAVGVGVASGWTRHNGRRVEVWFVTQNFGKY